MTGLSLTFGPGGGSGLVSLDDAAVLWARLQSSTLAGATSLVLDRPAGLLDLLPETRLLIDVGDGAGHFDYQEITPADVSGSTVIALPRAMTYAHDAGDVVALLSPNQGIPATWLGCGGSSGAEATRNKAAINRVAAHGGLFDLAGGAGILFDGGIQVDDTVFIMGSKCWLRGIGGQVTGGDITAHTNFSFAGDLSKSLIAVQDDAGLYPTLLDDTNAGAPFRMSDMSLIGKSGSVPDSVGIVYSPDGGKVENIKYRYFDHGWCFGNGPGAADLQNMQCDFARYMMVIWNDGWTLKNFNCVQGVPGVPGDNVDNAAVRMIGGKGGTILGGDLEIAIRPGRHISMEGDASGLVAEGVFTSGFNALPATSIDIDTDSPAYYDFINYYCNTVDPTAKILRDVLRGFSIQATAADIYGRTLWARTISDTHVVFSPGNTATSPAHAGVPHVHGTMG